MFVDEVVITVVGGKGGDGMVSFRREKYVPFGGPNGGNGGNGGSIILESENNVDTLSNFRAKKVFKAEDGKRGGSQKLTGKNGENLILKVPTGTIVFDHPTDSILHDFALDHDRYTVAEGGRGGYGNAHFVSSVRQAPRFAELGDQGKQKEIKLVLKLIADVGIIGMPNAGKSTLISIVSAAKPAIADYPFTTLTPHLGIVDHKGESFVICDNPGLIEGAAKGKGLGIEFLKHIERSRILLHLLDGSQEHPEKAFLKINAELQKYSKELSYKKQIVAINKIDLLSTELMDDLRKEFFKKKIIPIFISAATGKNMSVLLDEIISTLQHIPKTPFFQAEYSIKVFRPHQDNPLFFDIVKKRNRFIILGTRIEQIARMTPQGNKEALERVYDVLRKIGVYKELVRQGAKDGQTLQIASLQLPFRL